jgi:hypothetical protein
MEEMKKSRIKSPRFVITLLPAIVIVVVLIWFFGSIFEGEKPQAELSPLPEYLSGNVAFTVTVSDTKMGLRVAKVSIKQEGPASTVLEKAFPYNGLLNKKKRGRWQSGDH